MIMLKRFGIWSPIRMTDLKSLRKCFRIPTEEQHTLLNTPAYGRNNQKYFCHLNSNLSQVFLCRMQAFADQSAQTRKFWFGELYPASCRFADIQPTQPTNFYLWNDYST